MPTSDEVDASACRSPTARSTPRRARAVPPSLIDPEWCLCFVWCHLALAWVLAPWGWSPRSSALSLGIRCAAGHELHVRAAAAAAVGRLRDHAAGLETAGGAADDARAALAATEALYQRQRRGPRGGAGGRRRVLYPGGQGVAAAGGGLRALHRPHLPAPHCLLGGGGRGGAGWRGAVWSAGVSRLGGRGLPAAR
jgi:hypothetical protein